MTARGPAPRTARDAVQQNHHAATVRPASRKLTCWPCSVISRGVTTGSTAAGPASRWASSVARAVTCGFLLTSRSGTRCLPRHRARTGQLVVTSATAWSRAPRTSRERGRGRLTQNREGTGREDITGRGQRAYHRLIPDPRGPCCDRVPRPAGGRMPSGVISEWIGTVRRGCRTGPRAGPVYRLPR
jgi:hypothetical protein